MGENLIPVTLPFNYIMKTSLKKIKRKEKKKRTESFLSFAICIICEPKQPPSHNAPLKVILPLSLSLSLRTWIWNFSGGSDGAAWRLVFNFSFFFCSFCS